MKTKTSTTKEFRLTTKEFREIASLHDNVNPDMSDWSDEKLLEQSLGSDVGLDSLDIIDMVAEIETEYGIHISSEKFDDMMYPNAKEANVQKFINVCNACVLK